MVFKKTRGVMHQNAYNVTYEPSAPPMVNEGSVPRKKMRRSCIIYLVIFIIAIILLIVGIVIGSLWSSIYNWIFLRELTLTPTSTNYDMWKEIPIPMYLKFYFFNCTNADVFSKTTYGKPNFVELGPYVYREVDYKVNQVWNDNGTITFQRRKVWYFEESLSNGSLSDQITNINPIAVTFARMVKNQPSIVRKFVSKVLDFTKSNLFITRNVSQLLFDGYNDTLLGYANKLNLSTIPFNKFGWFYGRNGSDSYDGTFNILTGTTDIHDLGIVKEWNYSNKSKYYNGSCALVKGTNGELWPPLPNNKTVSIFVSDICTSVELTYDNETTYLGVTGSKYVSNETMLSTTIKSRQCYCANSKCQPSGTLDVSKCKYGAPAFISLPHFYLADISYRKAVKGMNPDKKKHEMFIIVEPDTGVPIVVNAQLQLNLFIENDESIRILKDVRNTYMPMLWFTQEAKLTPYFADKVKLLLILPTLGIATSLGVAGIGALIFFIGVFIIVRRKWYGEDNQVLISKNDINDDDRTNG